MLLFALHTHMHTASDYLCQAGAHFPIWKMRKTEATVVESLAHIHAALVTHRPNMCTCPQNVTAFIEKPRVWKPLSGREDGDHGRGLKPETLENRKAPHQDSWSWKPCWLEHSWDSENRHDEKNTEAEHEMQTPHMACKVHPIQPSFSCPTSSLLCI